MQTIDTKNGKISKPGAQSKPMSEIDNYFSPSEWNDHGLYDQINSPAFL